MPRSVTQKLWFNCFGVQPGHETCFFNSSDDSKVLPTLRTTGVSLSADDWFLTLTKHQNCQTIISIKGAKNKELYWSLRNCNSGDIDWGKTERVFREEKESGAYKDKSHKVVKVVWQELRLTLMQEGDICP